MNLNRKGLTNKAFQIRAIWHGARKGSCEFNCPLVPDACSATPP